MSFVGIISDNKFFEIIKEKIREKDYDKKINIIHVNTKSIDNIKNIKFEMIIINNEIEKIDGYKSNLEKICSNSEYLLINTDINKTFDILKGKKINIITYGLNHKSTVTISSISETDILIYLQRNIKNRDDKLLDVEEKRVGLKGKNRCKVYEVIVIYIILTIYGYSIIDEI